MTLLTAPNAPLRPAPAILEWMATGKWVETHSGRCDECRDAAVHGNPMYVHTETLAHLCSFCLPQGIAVTWS